MGRDSPEAAIYAIAHGIEHRDPKAVCERLFPSTLLPAGIAKRLSVAAGGGSPGQSWDSQNQACARKFGKQGEFESFDFEEPRIRSITAVPVRAEGGIKQAARATASLGRGAPHPLPLVEFRGRWRLVFEVK